MPALAKPLLQSVRWGLVRAEAVAWERYFCVDTREEAAERPLSLPTENIPYQPLPWYLVRRAIGALSLSSDDVFLDYGSGLGRALLMAAHHQLKRVLGVEFLYPLVKAAKDNLARAHHRLRSPVELVVADAAQFVVPDDVTVAYLFNPFVGKVMEAVQEQLKASLERRPRPLRVLYAHAGNQPDLFARRNWLPFSRQVGGGVFDRMNLTVYESALSGTAPHAEM